MAPGSQSGKVFSPPRDALLLGAAILLFFGPLLLSPFNYDDLHILTGRFVAGPWPSWGILFSRPADTDGAFEPLVTLFHRLVFRSNLASPLLLHLSSLLLHWLNAILFLRIARRRLEDKNLALCAALAFALFPAHAEILGVSAFKTHLAATLATLAALNLLDRPGTLFPLWALLAAGLLCKETAAVLPLLCLISDRRRRDIRLFIGWLVIGAGYAVLRLAVVPRPISPVGGNGLVPTAAKLWLWYLWKLAVPVGFCLEHGLSPVRGAFRPEGLAILSASLVSAAGLVMAGRRDKNSAFSAAWIAAALAPFLFVNLTIGLVADRYLYLASAGWALLIASLARRVAPKTAVWFVAAASAIYGTLGLRRAVLYTDPEALWREAAERSPDNPRAHAGLGAALYDHGKYIEAAAAYERALALKPDYWAARDDLAATERMLGHSERALDQTRRRLADRPDAEGYLRVAEALMDLGRCDEALEPLRQTVRLDPGNLYPKARWWLDQCESVKRESGGARRRSSPRRSAEPGAHP